MRRHCGRCRRGRTSCYRCATVAGEAIQGATGGNRASGAGRIAKRGGEGRPSFVGCFPNSVRSFGEFVIFAKLPIDIQSNVMYNRYIDRNNH